MKQHLPKVALYLAGKGRDESLEKRSRAFLFERAKKGIGYAGVELAAVRARELQPHFDNVDGQRDW
jgi:hypothetical protein